MNKRRWIILLIIVVALAIIGITLYYCLLCPSLYHSTTLKSQNFHVSSTKKQLLIGLWQNEGHEFYRFNADGTGHTWDIEDDLTEEEASNFTWEVYDNAILMTHKLRFRGIVPRYYELDCLNAFNFSFHDNYKSYTLERIEEQVVMEGD